MVYVLEDTDKVRNLFTEINDSNPLACLDKTMGKVYVTDPDTPKSAMSYLSRFAEIAGEPDRELVSFFPEGLQYIIPHSSDWAALVEEQYPDAEKQTRYAIRKDTQFCRERLEEMASEIPEGYELRAIDDEVYGLCAEDKTARLFVSGFDSKEEFLEHGRGFVLIKEGRIVSGASSYSWYHGGIEVQVITMPEERGKGLAGIVCARLILSCLEDGLYPNWDAASMTSVRLAERLGYEYSHEYACYKVAALT